MPEDLTKTQEIPKAYEPQLIESQWAQRWVAKQLFRAGSEPSDKTFSLVIPPPNVTGSIHIGHMLEHTEIDILVRWHRMRGFRTLWLPGMDHAGIATQVMVERELATEGLTREGVGREEFERRVWKWKEKSGGTIKRQMIRLGVSCDWSREKFTLDPPLYRAVLEAFLRLYHEGLIYRGRYIVNWCPRCRTALSDLEVVHQERQGNLWHIRYPIAGSSESLVVATTRPETMLGDTAVAVHPDDERYKHLVGKKVLLPLVNREIPVIADAYVDREFGTGVVKITPAHDPNDFAMGQRHHLEEIDVMTNDGKMNAAAGAYAGLDRFAARKRIVEDLGALGLLEQVTDHALSVGVCDRCKAVVEPRVSEQWFCKMKDMAADASAAVEQGLIPIVPENQRTIYLNWMANIRDWCISRQLWWGHRIPIWYCAKCKCMMPARDSRVAVVDGRAQAASPPERCGSCGSAELTQDTDVLDTWFSSGLWPFSTLGWPDDTADLRDFYPTTLLISGYDILFFWDARMIMMALHLMQDRHPAMKDRVPFRALYLHALVRDPEGMKMSKTRGNVVDPLAVIEEHGTDALRFTLANMAAPGTDIALSEDKILASRAFANKIWNAARFIFVNLEKFQAATGVSIEELASPEVREAAPYAALDAAGNAAGGLGEASLADRWIFSRLAETTATFNDALQHYRFHEAAHEVYHFFWGDFCDWYIEWVKPAMADPNREVATIAFRNLFAAFETALRLLHPFMPFLTEELWHRLPQRAGAESIALETFPAPPDSWSDPEAEKEVALLQEIITASRNIRAELKMDPRKRVPADISAATPETAELIAENGDFIQRLGSLSELHFSEQRLDPSAGPVRATLQYELRIPYETGDQTAEITRLQKQIEALTKDIASKQARLADQTFRSKAPEKIVNQLETTLGERRAELEKAEERLGQLQGGASPGTSSGNPTKH